MHTRLITWLKQRQRGYVLLLIGAVLALYLPFLSNPFFFDDLTFFSSAPVPSAGLDFLLRPRGIPYDSMLWTMQWFGSTLPHAYRLVDAVLHAATAVALFVLLRSLLQHSCGQSAQSSALDFAAAAAALVFALHPVASYVAGYIVQRSIAMATLFSLLCLWAWLNAAATGKNRWIVLAVLTYFLACFSKEHAVGLPLLIAAITVLMRRQLRLSPPALLLAALAMGGVALLIVLRMRGVVGTAYEPMAAHVFAQSGLLEGKPAHALSIATQAGLYFKYLLLWLLPVPGWMSVDMRPEFLTSLVQWKAWGGPLAFLLYGALAARLLFARGLLALAGFGLLYPWLMFLVEFSSVRVQEPLVLYRSYLWMPGLMLVLAVLLLWLQQLPAVRERILALPFARLGLLLLVVALLTPATLDRLTVASDTWRLWDDAAGLLENDAVAGADRILYNRGNAALAAGRPAQAVADLQRVARISPQLYQVHQALGLAHFANANPVGAEGAFRHALLLKPGNPVLLYAHAVTLKRLGRAAEAREEMTASCAAQHMPACLVVARLKVEAGGPD
ncbi:hypothetical protein [Lacisediminimonas profundi]|uniref:hypothetical protein n=1 Tax=Lacisediminimonas profundi TaxID=2603856 RepID=UPI00124B734E|nr:hypothetical protein [Lacisediminimonas profundi]